MKAILNETPPVEAVANREKVAHNNNRSEAHCLADR